MTRDLTAISAEERCSGSGTYLGSTRVELGEDPWPEADSLLDFAEDMVMIFNQIFLLIPSGDQALGRMERISEEDENLRVEGMLLPFCLAFLWSAVVP